MKIHKIGVIIVMIIDIHQRKVLILFTITICLFTMFGTVYAAGTTPTSLPKYDYLALGDSLAAGVTPYYTLNKSYTDYLSEKLKEEGILGTFNNYGVPGYTTSQVLGIVVADTNLPDHLSKIKNAEIITLDAGANDLIPLLRRSQRDPTVMQQVHGAIQTVGKNIATIISTIKYYNPNARVYVMGYYNAFPYYPQAIQNQLLTLLDSLNLVIENTATSLGATYVDTEECMDKHLTKYLPNTGIHPNLLGYKAIAGEFWEPIRNDFLIGLN